MPICVNNRTAKYNDDGTVTLIVAHENPGFANWLDPDGHTSGTMLLRWIRAKSHPVPACRLVRIADLPGR